MAYASRFALVNPPDEDETEQDTLCPACLTFAARHRAVTTTHKLAPRLQVSVGRYTIAVAIVAIVVGIRTYVIPGGASHTVCALFSPRSFCGRRLRPGMRLFCLR